MQTQVVAGDIANNEPTEQCFYCDGMDDRCKTQGGVLCCPMCIIDTDYGDDDGK